MYFVVGGGPAGLAAAIAARKMGLEVVVADGFEPPIDKACGEGLLPATLQALKQLDVRLDSRDGYPFHGIRFADHHSAVDAYFPRLSALGVRRTILHARMLESAQNCGVQLLWRTEVTQLLDRAVIAGGRMIRTRWIVGADGANSRVRQWIGLNPYSFYLRRFGLRQHYRVRHIRSMMHLLFNWAMRWELIPFQINPMNLVCIKGSSKREREPRTLTTEEFRRFIEHVAEPCRTMCILTACLGLRVSETLGLKWSDFDWDDLRVRIQRSWVAGAEDDVKTLYSKKWMPVDTKLASLLQEHKMRTTPSMLANDWVFANPETGKPYWPGRLQEHHLVAAGEAAGIGRVGWHTFRHTYSTLLRAFGVDVKVQQELLRHADIRTTMNIYTQALPQAMRDAHGKVVEMLLPPMRKAG